MSGMGRDRSRAVGEESVEVLHPHWKTLVWPVMGAFVIVAARNGSDIPLSRITDVSFRKSPLDRLLGCGTLVVEAAGEHAEIILPQVPHVERVSAALFQLAEDERLRASAGTQDDRRSDQR
jgi:hypothetical protein